MTDLPPSVHLEPGEGALPRVTVDAPAGTAQLYLHGAHLTAWQPRGHDPVLWLSAHSRFVAGSAIRGGVPICFPWFGPHRDDTAAPAHGFARVSDWTLVSAEEVGEDVVVTLGLTDSPASRASAWPHAFAATLRVRVGATLAVALEVRNTGGEPVTFEAALHTYLGVGDVRGVQVTGLEGNDYLDKLGGSEPVPAAGSPVHLTGETDRIYLDTSGTTTVQDPSLGRGVAVTADDAATTVLWNPWATKAAAMADLGDDEWTGMVCVETSNVGPAAVTLAPGASHTMMAMIGVVPAA